MQALVNRGRCREAGGRPGPQGGGARPRLVATLAEKDTKPRFIYDPRPSNKLCKKIPFSIDAVAWVASVASQRCFMTSPDGASAFHHVLLRPSPWPLFGSSYGGIDYCRSGGIARWRAHSLPHAHWGSWSFRLFDCTQSALRKIRSGHCRQQRVRDDPGLGALRVSLRVPRKEPCTL